MNLAPYESKYKYYGDEWLVFHDSLASLSDREGIFIELSFGLQLINPRELAFKTGGKQELLSRIECLIEVNREPDKSKHTDILKKYGLVVLPQPKKTENNNDSMYG